MAGAVTNGTRIAINRLEGNAEVNLILCDGAELVANGGIEVTRAPDHHLVIWAQSDGPDAGKLTATAGDDSAGIGGTHDNYSATEGLKYVPGGTVTINGGAITATGGGEGAGIGGGKGNACVWVTVNGGTVEALGGVSGGRAIDNGGSSSSNPTRMSLYARAKVTAGDDASSANPVAATNRVDACQSKSYAKIEPCGPHKYDNGICTWCGDIACTVTNVTAVQMSPTSGKVDITFDVVSGAVGQALQKNEAGVYLVVVATDLATWRSWVVEAGDASLEMSRAAEMGELGRHTVSWDMSDALGAGFSTKGLVFTVEYRARPAEYCVVDLSAGPSAAAGSYAVSYLDAEPTGGFNVDAYKTTNLVLRLIRPGRFEMCGYDVTLTKPYYRGVTNAASGQTWTPTKFLTGAQPASTAGKHRATWDTAADGVTGVVSTNVTVKVQLEGP